MTRPQQFVRGLMGHRMQRERQILAGRGRPRDIADIVAEAYPGLDPRLVPAAAGSVMRICWTSSGAGWLSITMSDG